MIVGSATRPSTVVQWLLLDPTVWVVNLQWSLPSLSTLNSYPSGAMTGNVDNLFKGCFDLQVTEIKTEGSRILVCYLAASSMVTDGYGDILVLKQQALFLYWEVAISF